jgi:DNA gyrase subunit A
LEIGTVRLISIEDEMRAAYLDYAMSVITARALPDVRDGLKPVQRRILYAMNEMGLRHDRPYRKSARIVGDVLGRYHPHGDQAVYEAQVRMAQDFSMRYPLVDGQGNFGSVDGDPPAAMRYTEARLARIAEELLTDLDKDTVDFVDNFDGSLKEPTVLPARLPNLLLNGVSGIAVGMATNIPPHNLGELCDALVHVIDNYDRLDEITVDELIQFLPGPDFPTGGSILGIEGIRNAYVTGQGRIVMRAKAHIEEIKGGRERIVVTELPYQVNKATLIERIADLVRSHRIDSISDLRDESDRQGMHIVIELKRGAESRTTLNQLLKYTQMQQTFGVNMLALVDGSPVRLSLKKALQHWIEHRREVIRRRSEFELAKARARAHILEGLRIALANLDEVINTIRRAPDADTARQRLIRRFKLTEVQAQAILDMQLRRLAALERQKIEAEYKEVIKQIAALEDLLASPRKILYVIRDDCLELKKEYGDARRSRIFEQETEEFREEDLIPQEDVLITITQRGYIKRVPASSYRPQRRGGRGVTGMTTREEDEVEILFMANTLDTALFFSNQGKVYSQRTHQLPDADRQAKGLPLSNLIPLNRGERITAAVPVPDFAKAEYIVLATVNGKIKRVELKEFESVRPSGIIAINLDTGDELGWAKLTRGDQEIIVVSERGQALRFSEDQVRPMGRNSAGVNAIKLSGKDRVTSVDVVRPGAELLLVTRNGYGKRTPLAEYPAKGRYTGGVKTIDTTKLRQIGLIASARVVYPSDEITIIASDGVVLRTWVDDVPQMGRATRGARMMDLHDGASVVMMARINGREEPGGPGEAKGPEGPKTSKPGPTKRTARARRGAKGTKAEGAKGTTQTRSRAKATTATAPARTQARKPKAGAGPGTDKTTGARAPARRTSKKAPAGTGKAEKKPTADKSSKTPSKPAAKPPAAPKTKRTRSEKARPAASEQTSDKAPAQGTLPGLEGAARKPK